MTGESTPVETDREERAQTETRSRRKPGEVPPRAARVNGRGHFCLVVRAAASALQEEPMLVGMSGP